MGAGPEPDSFVLRKFLDARKIKALRERRPEFWLPGIHPEDIKQMSGSFRAQGWEGDAGEKKHGIWQIVEIRKNMRKNVRGEEKGLLGIKL